MEWLQDNWLTIAVFLYAIGSEALGASSLKDNSIVQAIWRGIGKALRKG